MEHYSLEDLRLRVDISEYSFLDSDYSLDKNTVEAVLWNLLHSASPTETLQYEQLLSRLFLHSGRSPFMISMTISEIGLAAYERDELLFAEFCFRTAKKYYMSDSSIDNNLAYILRRSHKTDAASKSEIISLLLPGVKKRDEFSLVNMALTLAVNLGTDSDWLIADKLIRQIEETSGIMKWWGMLAERDDAEGYLVIQWLLRHSMLPQTSPCASQDGLADKVKKAYPNAPDWLFDFFVPPDLF